MDIQLHTHRHHFSLDDPIWNEKEIRENRSVLEGLTERPLRHFCFPSGRTDPSQYPVLEKEGIVTATIGGQRLNFQGCHPYEIGRFLDSETISEIEFEAWLSGTVDLLRQPSLAVAPRERFRIHPSYRAKEVHTVAAINTR